jgi:hypothetical protein
MIDLLKIWYFDGGGASLPPQEAAPTSNDPATKQAAAAAALAERDRARKRAGFSSTIKTGGGGLKGSPDLSRPSLLGATGGSLGQPGGKALLGE